MNIDYTIDLDGFGFVRSVTNYTSLRDHRLAHRDKLSLKIRFTRSGVAQDVGTLDNDETHFTVKKLNEENEVLSDDSTITTWTKTTSGTDVYYTHDGVVDLDTVELETLIGQSATALVDTQFTWKVGSTIYRSRLLKTTIERALYPATLNPTLATDPARSYVTMLQNVDKLDGDGSGSVALESITTVGLQVPRWFSFVRATDGLMYYFKLQAGTDAESGISIRRPDDYNATTNAKVFSYQTASHCGGAIICVARNLPVTSTGASSDIGTIVIPEWITRWSLLQGSSTAGRIIVETNSGSSSANVNIYTAPDGGGVSVVTGNILVPSASGSAIGITALGPTVRAFDTVNTLYVRQITNSSGSGTISVYLNVSPLI